MNASKLVVAVRLVRCDCFREVFVSLNMSRTTSIGVSHRFFSIKCIYETVYLNDWPVVLYRWYKEIAKSLIHSLCGGFWFVFCRANSRQMDGTCIIPTYFPTSVARLGPTDGLTNVVCRMSYVVHLDAFVIYSNHWSTFYVILMFAASRHIVPFNK